MPREDDKIISFEQKREQAADKKRAEAAERRAAEKRRQLAERGPATVRTGRAIGRAVLFLVGLVAAASVGAWIWAMLG